MLALAACRGPAFDIMPRMTEGGRVVFDFRAYRGGGVDIYSLIVHECQAEGWMTIWWVGRDCDHFFGIGCDVSSIAYGETRGMRIELPAKPLVSGRRYWVSAEGDRGSPGGAEFTIDANGAIKVLPVSRCEPSQSK